MWARKKCQSCVRNTAAELTKVRGKSTGRPTRLTLLNMDKNLSEAKIGLKEKNGLFLSVGFSWRDSSSVDRLAANLRVDVSICSTHKKAWWVWHQSLISALGETLGSGSS